MRKIVQIAAASEGDTTYTLLYALCEDGTVWMRPHSPHQQLVWEQLPPIPSNDTEVSDV